MIGIVCETRVILALALFLVIGAGACARQGGEPSTESHEHARVTTALTVGGAGSIDAEASKGTGTGNARANTRAPIAIPPFTGGPSPATLAAPSCGNSQEPCCPGRSCATGLACVHKRGQAICLACGGPGGPCCADGYCSGGCCVRSPASGMNRCVATGAGPCAGDGETCTASGRCSSTCGAPGQPCCANTSIQWCYVPGTACLGTGQTASCVACGKAGQPCCAAVDGCESPLTCQSDPTGAKVCNP